MRGLALLGLVLFAVSWFVPVHQALGPADDVAASAREIGRAFEGGGRGPWGTSGPPGWRACRAAWELPGSQDLKQTLLRSTSLTNLVMALAAVAVLARMRGAGARGVGVLLLACAALDAGWLYHTDDDFRGGLLAGYWLWLASFAVVGASLVSHRTSTAPAP